MTKTDSEFEERIQLLLRAKKFKNILDLLKTPENDSYVTENTWNIISSVCLTIKTNKLLKNDKDVKLCKKVLLSLVSRGNPKEVLVSLLEQADSFKDHEFFCVLLDPIQHVLHKAPGKRGKTLQWVLSTLNAHIETLPPPQDLDLEGEERLLLDADPAVLDATYVISNYLSFIECFVNEVSFINLKNREIHYFDRICSQQEILHKYILKIFYQPLLYHDLHILSVTRPKSNMRVICEKYVKCLSKICHNVFNLFKYTIYTEDSNKQSKTDEEEEDDDEDDSVPLLAFSNLSYLIFVESIAIEFQPFVYSHLFTFMTNLRYIIPLLKRRENLILFKGLHLAENLINKLDDSELDYDYIELDAFTEFPKLLLNIAIHCPTDIYRKLAVDVFTSYISKCNYKGKYHLIMQVLSTIDHSGVQGLVIRIYKTHLHEALNGNASFNYFLGKNLNLFLKKIFVLKEGVETDILENSDIITSCLNILRYLLLRDKRNENITGIWDLLSSISKDFLIPLSTGLDLSRAHYKQALIDFDTVKGIMDKDVINATVTVNDEILPNMPLHFQKFVFQRALTTFDVIESILSRVLELISDCN